MLFLAFLSPVVRPALADQVAIKEYVTELAVENDDQILNVEWCNECGYYWVDVKGGGFFNSLNLHRQKMYLMTHYCAKEFDGMFIINNYKGDTFGISINKKYHEICSQK